MSIPTYDVAVIGGGIIGLSTAMALANRGRRSLVVLEAERELAAHQSGRNSGVIHSGLYYKPGSQKAHTCTAGREALYHFCKQHGILHERCGKIVVATEAGQLAALDQLLERGLANELVGLRKLTPEQIREREPHVRGVAALLVPHTGIVDFRAVTHAFAGIVHERGGEILTAARVHGVRRLNDQLVIKTRRGSIGCKFVINCGGLQADRIARMCGVEPGLRIVPIRGEFHRLAPTRRCLVKHLVYAVPDLTMPFLGAHFTRMLSGDVQVGPNAIPSLSRAAYDRGCFCVRDATETIAYPGFWRMMWKHRRAGVGELQRMVSRRALLRQLRRIVPELDPSDLRRARSGLRAQAVGPNGRFVDDFRIVQADRMVHVLNAPSPAATASIAIGSHIAGLAESAMG